MACARARWRSVFDRSLAALAVLAAAGCASGGSGTASLDNVWREDMGRMTKATLSQGLAKIAQKYTLRIDRDEDRPRDMYYELAWIPRDVMADEEARGITNARNRIVLRGVLLESGFGAGGEAFRVTWQVDNEVMSAMNTSWHPDVMPAQVVEQFRPIFSDLSMEIRTALWR